MWENQKIFMSKQFYLENLLFFLLKKLLKLIKRLFKLLVINLIIKN